MSEYNAIRDAMEDWLNSAEGRQCIQLGARDAVAAHQSKPLDTILSAFKALGVEGPFCLMRESVDTTVIVVDKGKVQDVDVDKICTLLNACHAAQRGGRMGKKKGPTFAQIHSDNIERRDFEVHGEDVEYPSSRVIFFDCPFCQTEVKAYTWSLAGGGKRCSCGALFTHGGYAYHFKGQADEK